MILLIDNYDSFTYNLVQILAAAGAEVRVFRNDAVTVDEVEALHPQALVISPGPGDPTSAGISMEVIRRFAGRKPLLGVCLGHQAIGAVFGATIGSAGSIRHGKASDITHDGSALYQGMANPFPAGRYHSLAIRRDTLPPELVVDATSDDGEIMGIHHVDYPLYGVQFHPESVLTPSGKRLLRNFIVLAERSPS
ncbi:MAG: aminodeoxychorismate/anthranilate synthase component II [Kiritimatiellia bacterium]|nr:aminodeoxychorismate/anthranilate synthase component II [Kiritimatiellia bacterium]